MYLSRVEGVMVGSVRIVCSVLRNTDAVMWRGLSRTPLGVCAVAQQDLTLCITKTVFKHKLVA